MIGKSLKEAFQSIVYCTIFFHKTISLSHNLFLIYIVIGQGISITGPWPVTIHRLFITELHTNDQIFYWKSNKNVFI